MKIVSDIRPTGNTHLGNYLGVIKQWKELQDATRRILYQEPRILSKRL